MESRRLQKEFEELFKLNTSPGQNTVSAHMVGNDMHHLKGIIKGPVSFISVARHPI